MYSLAVVLCVLDLAGSNSWYPIVKTTREIEMFRNFLESSRLSIYDTRSLYVTQKLAIAANAEENSGKYEGDILLDRALINEMIPKYALGLTDVYTFPNTTWPEHTVVWDFNKRKEFDNNQKNAIKDSITLIEENTCIRFRRRRSGDRAYVLVSGANKGCYAHVGYWAHRGAHLMNLQRDEVNTGCFRVGTIVHEWFHILGLLHMHSVTDRDDYIQIVNDNLIPGAQNNFALRSPDLTNVSYDYESVLHFGPYAFSKNNKPTIAPKQKLDGIQMGQRDYVTDKDWLRVNRLYNCPGAWRHIYF